MVMIKERGILDSIAVLLAAVAFLFFYSAHKAPPEASRAPVVGQWTSGFQVEPLTHPPWWWR
jgi:hypothetical protein